MILQAYLYITRAFKDYTPHVMGALKLLAASYSVDELNKLGMHMYVSTKSTIRHRYRCRSPKNAFKPDTVEWGQRATLECVKILDQLKAPLASEADEVEALAQAEAAVAEQDNAESLSKPVRTVIPPDGPDAPDDLSDLSDAPPSLKDEAAEPKAEIGDVDGPPAKKQMTLEEYEAMLDAEDAEGGFLEAGNIV
jgi:hypothetical protein